MRINEKLRAKLCNLSIRKRLTYSNILMFLIPVAVTIITAIVALGITIGVVVLKFGGDLLDKIVNFSVSNSR